MRNSTTCCSTNKKGQKAGLRSWHAWQLKWCRWEFGNRLHEIIFIDEHCLKFGPLAQSWAGHFQILQGEAYKGERKWEMMRKLSRHEWLCFQRVPRHQSISLIVPLCFPLCSCQCRNKKMTIGKSKQCFFPIFPSNLADDKPGALWVATTYVGVHMNQIMSYSSPRSGWISRIGLVRAAWATWCIRLPNSGPFWAKPVAVCFSRASFSKHILHETPTWRKALSSASETVGQRSPEASRSCPCTKRK